MSSKQLLEFKVSRAEAGLRLDRFLAEKIPWRSRQNLQRLARQGKILVNGTPRKSSHRIQDGDEIHTPIPVPASVIASEVPDIALEILYEDDFVLAINKPPMLACVPTGRHMVDNVVSLLRHQYAHLPDPPQPVHRLDRETSGVLLVAKTAGARSDFSKLFEQRKVSKLYWALCSGIMENGKGVISVPVGNDPSSRVKIRQAAGRGRPSASEYRVIARIRETNLSLVEVRILTSRAHQIRVHMAHMGHPVLGDKIYGPSEELFLKSLEVKLDEDDLHRLGMGRHALHARSLELEHPVSGHHLRITAPIPADMECLLKNVKA